MIKKLAKKVFSKEVDSKHVISTIENFIKENKLEKEYVLTNLTTELMKLKANSVYFNSEFIKRNIIAEVGGILIYQNSDAKFDEILFIIGPKSTNVNGILSQINNINDSNHSEEEINKSIIQIQNKYLNNGVEIKILNDFKNQKNISRLHFDIKQGETVQLNQVIGYFEDYQFNTTAINYMTKYNIVENYINSISEKPKKINSSDRPRKVEEIKKKTLIEIWNKQEIDKYHQFIELLKEEILLPKHKPETTIAFIKENPKGKLKWNKTLAKLYQRYLAGFLRVAADNEYIDISDYSTQQLLEISKNTFFDKDDKLSIDSFNVARTNYLDEKYLIPFQKMIKGLH